MFGFSNADTFFRNALYSAPTYYELGRVCQLLTLQKDAEGGAIIFIFKKANAYRESAKIPWRLKMTHRRIWHHFVFMRRSTTPSNTLCVCVNLVSVSLYGGLDTFS